MRVGLDYFTIRELGLTPFQALDFTRDQGLAGIQFGGVESLSPRRDGGELQAIRDYADELGLYTHISIGNCNPCLSEDLDTDRRVMENDIRLAAECGWHEMRGTLGGGEERYVHAVPWPSHLTQSASFLRSLSPVLREHGSRINIETHGDTTTFELVRLVEDVGPAIAGICLDTANLLCHAEEPVAAARRAAPYTHMTHCKDAIVFFTAEGYRRQTLPPGQGALPWTAMLPALAAYEPDLALSIEDHKWLFDFPILDPSWLSHHPDLTREELAAVVRFAGRCESGLRSGEFKNPEEIEKTPYREDLENRLASGREYLTTTLDKLGLTSPPWKKPSV